MGLTGAAADLDGLDEKERVDLDGPFDESLNLEITEWPDRIRVDLEDRLLFIERDFMIDGNAQDETGLRQSRSVTHARSRLDPRVLAALMSGTSSGSLRADISPGRDVRVHPSVHPRL